ncbi:DUF6766 family protein [Amycolatopsis sp. NPDC051373]|uniref:DUF6766 family protein n=1 Tax=Amycolatopsis sp. NPDC051373 TaxID=3155801 RepID=UPI00344FA29F
MTTGEPAQRRAAERLRRSVSWAEHLGSAGFWNRTLRNGQPEFLAIGSMALRSVYLRQRGSPEATPVGAPHQAADETG